MGTVGRRVREARIEADGAAANVAPEGRLRLLKALEKKILWLSAWTIHNANHIRPNPDGLKVGGHQASSASLVTVMTALYLDVLRPQDRVAVKPHASPVFHAIQYLLGQQTQENLEAFRSLGGAQSYPSRTKDADDVDFSTGSVGLGVAMTLFASIAQDYVALKDWGRGAKAGGRMVALLGDAELDEGNIYEALLEGWKHDVRNVWWVIDYNRQSLDSIVTERLFARIDKLFENMGWRVVTLKYGGLLETAFGWRAIFYFMTAMSLGVAVLIAIALPETRRAAPSSTSARERTRSCSALPATRLRFPGRNRLPAALGRTP